MSFHSKQQAALRVYDAFVEAHPALEVTAAKLKAHYMDGGLEKPSPYFLHGTLKLLTETDFARAAGAMSQELRIHIMQAEKYLIDAVNQGPDFLQRDEEMLHAKGIMRGSKKYFLGVNGIEPSGAYDTGWKAMSPSYRPIAADAVQNAMSTKDKTISKKVLKYVAVSLMPEDDLKYLELNKLSMQYGKDHTAHLKEASIFIRASAKEHGIDIPEAMLHGLLAPKAKPYERIEALPRFITKPAVAIASPASEKPLRNNFVKGVTASERPAVFQEPTHEAAPEQVLKQRLERLEKRGEISRREHKIYYYLNTEGKNGPRLIADAVDYLRKHEGVDKGERYVRLMITNVDMKLRALDAANDASSQPSNGDRHQPRTVRPE